MKYLFRKSNIFFWILILLSFIVGTILRCYLISSQIIIDDEWHGINYVIGKSLFYVFTNHGLGANSIPMNIYRWCLLNTIGWSELSLRAPIIISGVLSLIVFPVFVAKMFNRRTTIISSFLFAMSPVLVFYSRMSRPYGIVVVLSFVSFFSLLFWINSGKNRFAFLYIFTAVLSIYFHLYALVLVLTPLGIVFILKIIQRYSNHNQISVLIMPNATSLFGAGVTIFSLLCVLILPAHIQNLWWLHRLGYDRMNFETILNYVSIISGTSNNILIVLFLLMFLTGLLTAFRRKTVFAISIIVIIAVYFIVMSLSHQEGSHAAIQAVRYSISIIPFVLILVAFGLDRILCYFNPFIETSKIGLILIFLIPSAILLNLFTFGPLLATYQFPNNFTNHSAFQDSYKSHIWTYSRSRDLTPGYLMKKEDISKFYFLLSKQSGVHTIIEYPMLMGDPVNLYYYCQHFHKKNILVGYSPNLIIPKRTQDYILGQYSVDYVMSRLPDLKKVKFKNMVDMDNIDAIKSSKAAYIILHKHLISEMFPYLKIEKVQANNAAVIYYSQTYRKYFGNPIFEDKNIIVFRI